MTLGFTEKINGKPNYFIEKIWESIIRDLEDPDLFRKYKLNYFLKLGKYWDGSTGEYRSFKPKHHTIREDIHDLWQPFKMIHPVVGNRTKKRFQFAPEMLCKAVQKIEIRRIPLTIPRGKVLPAVWIDGKLFYDIAEINKKRMQTLAENDGFESIEAFFEYFNQDHYVGKIIHWTDLRY